MTESAALEARSLYRFYRAGDDETLALRGVSISIAAGEVVAVVGPSGSGKSTLLACCAGLDEPAGGQVLVGGERLSHRSEVERARLRGERIGVLFQSNNLIEHLTLAQNVQFARGLARHRAASAVDRLTQVGLERRSHAYPRQLSGGELARAGLAVALANDPVVLLADEPTGELDGDTESAVLDLLRERAADGCGVMLVTHSADVMRFADRVVRLVDGSVAA